jgi:transposase
VTELEAAQQKRIAELEEKLEQTQRQLDLLIRHVFGKRSEQTPPPPVPGQMDLELETENAAIENAAPVKADKPKGGSKKGRQVRGALLPDDLPVEETVIIPPAVQAEPDRWREISREISERLERIPGRLIRQRLIRPVFVSLDQPHAPPVTAPAPPQLIPGGFFGPQFLADMVLDKYLRHLPLYRQAQGVKWESGVILSAATMCQTIARIADLVDPVMRAMADKIWQSPCVQMDLTPVRCLSRTHSGGSFLGHLWVAAVPGGDVIFTWDKSKAASVADRIIPEWYQGVLQTDGGSELACWLRGGKGRPRPPSPAVQAGCWAHVRRKFVDGAKDGCLICKRLLKLINLLYRIEGIAREGAMSPAERALIRQRRALRVIAKLRRRMDQVIAKERPKSRAASACLYALGQWKPLLVFLERGEVEIDNNSVENAIRPCALGRKNWLFIGDAGAGQRAATLYTLIGSCLRRGINPRAYLHWLFTNLPAATNRTVHTLTPAAYAQLHPVCAAGGAQAA